ncbi:phage tail protein [Thalassospira xiamenensis]|uniref:phage tail protein n=1 Tax=Thalassospira xiamenensis TaxID=220697 RepID=UPI000DEE0277|nr:tail fiber protein [Thalassospira xiamenensis]
MKNFAKQARRTGIFAIFATVTALGSIQPSSAAECTTDGYTGSVCWTAARYCPENHLPADGRTLPVNGNDALYALIGTTFGGSAVQFNLPDLRGRTIAGTGTSPDVNVNPVALAQMHGAEIATITPDNLPPHSHSWQFGTAQVTGTLQAKGALGSTENPAGAMFAERSTAGTPASRTPVYATSSNGTLHADAVTLTSDPATNRTENTGSNSVNIALNPAQQPLLACIVVQGIFPVRPN